MTSTANVNATQFEGFTGGPAEALERAYPNRSAYRPEPSKQGQLFSPESIPPQAAHHQTPDQFAQDARTWWHGRVTRGGSRSSLGGSGVGRGEGFHAGTYGAAEQRLKTNVGRGLKPGMAGHMYPLRITGPVDPAEEPQPDMNKHVELGPRRQTSWGGSYVGGRKAGYVYKNEIEGGGAMSVGVPQRKGFLSTQREMVASAKKGGQYVHPNIEWAVKGRPEHTPEEIGKQSRWRPPAEFTDQGQQLGLHEQFHQGTPAHEFQADPRRLESFKELYPDRTNTFRTSYETESGRTKHAYAFGTGLPGSALLSKQWQPSS